MYYIVIYSFESKISYIYNASKPLTMKDCINLMCQLGYDKSGISNNTTGYAYLISDIIDNVGSYPINYYNFIASSHYYN